MKLGRPQARFFHSISFRFSATCWAVTLMALALYLAVNLPQQKKDLLEALRSKAQGLSSSLQDVTAGAAVSEDYSTVVEHCIQVLKGDDAIDYLVITKTDGYSVIVQRDGWRIETLDRFWRPENRTVIGEIAYVPLVGKRVFRYARPFDYSAIHWGWVNVGLSTQAYDHSVALVYQRSAYLGILSAALSMIVSLAQASRLVRPIVTLQGVVGEVARGDLSARADLKTGDEVEDLAKSFNAMADTIRDRNRILESVRFAGQQLLGTEDWSAVVGEVLSKVGQAAIVSRAYLFENHLDAGGAPRSRELLEWTAPAIQPGTASRGGFFWACNGASQWAEKLARGQVVSASFPPGSPSPVKHPDPSIRALIAIPIRAGGNWWGLLAFDECLREREWSEAEKDSFQAVADMLGSAIARQRAKAALLEANENLERRVLERTSELQEQVRAREEANSRLAEAQQRLMSLSRQAGMAEVATGVLHNVGNVLNSVNVSATIVANKVRESRLANLVQIATMLDSHTDDLPAFLTADPKGQRIAPYLVKLSGHLAGERQVMLRELELLTGHVGHIKEIVATQQSYAKVSGLIEVISLPELAEDAIRIVAPSLERHEIRLERDYQPTPPVPVDKHSVLQILLNLLRNAKQAISGATPLSTKGGLIRVSVRPAGDGRVQIAVADNGAGLPPENLTRIFAHGFTTRRDGHGFGLHSGANAARQMGGSLHAESEGEGRGATFILELPIDPRANARRPAGAVAPSTTQPSEKDTLHEAAQH